MVFHCRPLGDEAEAEVHEDVADDLDDDLDDGDAVESSDEMDDYDYST